MDFGVDFAPAGVGVEVEVFAAPVEGLGDEGGDFVAVDGDEAVGRQLGQAERARVGEVALVHPEPEQLLAAIEALVHFHAARYAEGVVVNPNLAIFAHQRRTGHEELAGAVVFPIPRFDTDKGRAVGHAIPGVQIARDGHFNLVDAGEVGGRRRDGTDGVEDGGEADVQALIGHDGHVVDLGVVVFVIDDRRGDVRGVVDDGADALAAVFPVGFVGVEDEFGRGEVVEVAAGRQPDRAAPLGGLLDQGEELLGIGIVRELGLVLTGDKGTSERGPGKAVGRDGTAAAAAVEQGFVAAVRVWVALVADDVVQARAVGVAGDVVVFAAVPLI